MQNEININNDMKKITKNETQSKSAQRRLREKEIRRESILRAAEKLFAEKGYRKTRIEDIADMAEVSVGAVYGHFKNKEELLVHVLGDIGLYVRKLAAEAFSEAGTTLEGIEKAGMAFFEGLCVQHPEKVLLLYDEAIGLSPQFLSARKNFMMKMTADVNHAIMQVKKDLGMNFSSAISAEVTAVCTTAIFVWLGHYFRLWQKKPRDIMAIGRETVTFIVGGIKNLAAG
jgi:AcrR family transcriptional regulator